MWRFGIWFSRHGGVGLVVGLDDLRGLIQPMILCGGRAGIDGDQRSTAKAWWQGHPCGVGEVRSPVPAR